MALAKDPRLLVLDEPTTGLDATVEAEVLDLVRTLRRETDAAILLIAHNLGVIRSMCDRVGVMYAGKVVEEGPAQQVFDQPSHPYTVGLLNALPRHGVRKDEQLLATIPGSLPQIGASLPTCVFVDRCQLATDICREQLAPVVQLTRRALDPLPSRRSGAGLGCKRQAEGCRKRRVPPHRARDARRVEDVQAAAPRRARAGRRRSRSGRGRDARARR